MANQKSSRRFTAERTANNFASKVNGTASDLRGNENRRSDFKVNYTKDSMRDFGGNIDPIDRSGSMSDWADQENDY